MSAKWWPNRRQHLVVNLRRLLGYFLDLAAFSLSAFVAFELRFDGQLPAQYFHTLWTALCIWALAKSIAFIVVAVGWGHWRLTSVNEIVRIVLANSLGSIVGGSVIFLLLGWSRSALCLCSRLACLLPVDTRRKAGCASCGYGEKVRSSDGERTRTLIYGAGAAGRALVRELLQNESLMCDVIGLIDDDPRKLIWFSGKACFGPGEALGAWVQRHVSRKFLLRSHPRRDRRWCES